MQIIPSIDLMNNRVVRLRKGEFSSKMSYDLDPLDLIERYHNAGFSRIHLVDLLGAKDGVLSLLPLIREIKSSYDIKLQTGGGIRKTDDAKGVLEAGADYVVIGSVFFNDRAEFVRILDFAKAERIICSMDAMNETIMVKGWTESSGVNIFEGIREAMALGVKDFLITDISKDGMLTGPSVDLYQRILTQNPGIRLCASGGLGSLEDVRELSKIGLTYAVMGRALMENRVKPWELKEFAG